MREWSVTSCTLLFNSNVIQLSFIITLIIIDITNIIIIIIIINYHQSQLKNYNHQCWNGVIKQKKTSKIRENQKWQNEIYILVKKIDKI